MDELSWLRLLGGGFGSGLDWAVIVAFFAMAVVYVVVPVLGYRPDRRGLILCAMYLLIGYGALSFLQLVVQYFEQLDRVRSRGGDAAIHLHFMFTIVKTFLLVMSMVLFVIGLQVLRLRRPEMDEMPWARKSPDTSERSFP